MNILGHPELNFLKTSLSIERDCNMPWYNSQSPIQTLQEEEEKWST